MPSSQGDSIHAALPASGDQESTPTREEVTIFWIADRASFRISSVSPSCERLLGHSVAELTGRRTTWPELAHPDDRDRVTAAYRRRASGATEAVQYRLRRGDGSMNDPDRLFGVLEDVVTASGPQPTAAPIIEAPGPELSLLGDTSFDLLWNLPMVVLMAHDPFCRRITGNRAAYELLQMLPGSNLSLNAPETERPTHFRMVLDGQPIRPSELPLQLATITGTPRLGAEFELTLNDGSRYRLRGNATPIRDAEGAIRGGIAAYLDVTEGPPQTMPGGPTEPTLELLDGLRDAVVTLDPQGRLTAANARAAELAGRDRRQLIGQPAAEAWPWLVDAGILAVLPHVCSRAKPVSGEHWHDPSGLWFDYRVFPITGGVAVITRDISHQKATEQARQSAGQR